MDKTTDEASLCFANLVRVDSYHNMVFKYRRYNTALLKKWKPGQKTDWWDKKELVYIIQLSLGNCLSLQIHP